MKKKKMGEGGAKSVEGEKGQNKVGRSDECKKVGAAKRSFFLRFLMVIQITRVGSNQFLGETARKRDRFEQTQVI